MNILFQLFFVNVCFLFLVDKFLGIELLGEEVAQCVEIAIYFAKLVWAILHSYQQGMKFQSFHFANTRFCQSFYL